jgi:hypothetical protein
MGPLAFLLLSLVGQTTNQAPPPSAAPPPILTPAAKPFLKEISPGIVECNGVRLDKAHHRISFTGMVNQRQGLIEYLVVNEKGKVHESLFSTKVLPHDIHLALLLIGLKDPGSNSKEPVPPSAIDAAYLQSAPKLKGPDVHLTVKWTDAGKETEIPAEDWVFNLDTKQPMSNGPWTYNGSRVENGVFLADQEFSIVAVITDPTALVNNTRKGYDNEDIWQCREASIPPINTPVEIGIVLGETNAAKP